MAGVDFVAEANRRTSLPPDCELPPGYIYVKWWHGTDANTGPSIITRIWTDPVVQVNQVVYISEGYVDEHGDGRVFNEATVHRVTNLAMSDGRSILTEEPRASVLQRIAAQHRRLHEALEK